MAHARPSPWALYAEPILGILAFVIAVTTFAAVSDIADTSPNDFTVFMESARSLRAGGDLYGLPHQSGPGYNLNPPAVILLFVPFSFLPDAVGLRVWTALAIAAYLLASRWIARSVAPGRTASVAAAILLSQPAITSLLLGQIGGVLMLLITASWLADRNERPFLAGALLGVAIGAKPFLVICAAYLVWRRSRELAAGLVAGIAGTAVAGLIAAGAAGFRSWLAAIGQISWSAHVANASLLGLLTRTLSTTPEILHATPLVERPDLVQPLWWTSVVLVFVIGAWALVRTRSRAAVWALLLVGSLLVSPLGWVYYGAIFAGPLLAVARDATRAVRFVIAVGYACVLVPPLSVTTFGAIGILLFGSIYAWGFLLMFAGVALAARRT